jgi:hypothetical protein
MVIALLSPSFMWHRRAIAFLPCLSLYCPVEWLSGRTAEQTWFRQRIVADPSLGMMIKCNHVQVYGVQMSIRHGHIQRAIPSGSPCHAIPYGVTSTVKVAWLLVTLPAELLTITENIVPLSLSTVTGVV